MMNNEISVGRFLRIVLILITLGILYFVLDSLSGVLLPFFVAWLIAYLLYPMVCFFQYKVRLKYRMPAIIVSLIVMFAAIVSVFLLIVPSMIGEFAALKSSALSFFAEQIKNPSIPSFYCRLYSRGR